MQNLILLIKILGLIIVVLFLILIIIATIKILVGTLFRDENYKDFSDMSQDEMKSHFLESFLNESPENQKKQLEAIKKLNEMLRDIENENKRS